MKTSVTPMTVRRNNNGGLVVTYNECRRNQAEHLGLHALDGCQEFLASGNEGDAVFICDACGCHRNFHRREVRVVQQQE